MSYHTYQITPTLGEAKEIGKRFGYTITRQGDQYRVRVKNKREGGVFLDDVLSAQKTVRALAEKAFAEWTSTLPIIDEIKDALNQWHSSHGVKWKEELSYAWYSGNYGSFSHDNVSSYLQRFRNTNGHEVLWPEEDGIN